MTPNAWAVSAGVSRTVWADMRRHGNPSRRTLEKLLAAAGSSLAEFEALRVGEPSARSAAMPGRLGESRGRTWAPPPLPALPLLASSFGGNWGGPGSGIELTEIQPGELLDRLPRPASLAYDPDAYAITIIGDSMWPRFRPGRRIVVSPKSPVAIGDDVLVRLRGDGDATVEAVLIKELVRRTADLIELRQFNPDLNFRVSASDVESIEKIAGELF